MGERAVASDSSSYPTVKRRCVSVCQNRSCLRSGSEDVLASLQQQAPDGVFVQASSCLGQCGSGPMVQVNPDNVWYCRVRVKDVPKLVEEHLIGDRPVRNLLHPRFHPPSPAYYDPTA
ncbi:(2Fe-2S) ferredoxin domain-containing protein [Leptolyngbya sp. AN02str]|uniref:(2Fe-2S) ferredoxin domain-containing protein n=1 Tax=Leptolyngbya sp. AN02str TaxID=3423363 RepID=UPI003D31347E